MKIAGHTIQFGLQAGKTTLECTCGRVMSVVKSDERLATERAFDLGRDNIKIHLDDPSLKIVTAVTAVAA